MGTLPTSSNADITNAVNNSLTGTGIPKEHVTIIITVNGTASEAGNAKSGDAIAVTVSVPVSRISWLPAPFFLNDSSQLTGLTAMRRE